MSTISDPVAFPELIIGTAGPIGVDMDALSETLMSSLKQVGYRAIDIKLTREMLVLDAGIAEKADEGKFAEYNWKMDYANALRKKYGYSDTLARLAVFAVRNQRALYHL